MILHLTPTLMRVSLNIAASVILRLFICGNEKCHTTDAPLRMSGTLFFKVNNIHNNEERGHILQLSHMHITPDVVSLIKLMKGKALTG